MSCRKTGQERLIKSCLICKELFQTHPVFIKRGQGRFCSIPCARKAVTLGLVKHILSPVVRKKMSEMMKGNKFALGRCEELHPSWKGGLPKCLDCGNKISRMATRCISCSGKLMSKDKSSNWKGDKISYRALHRWIENWLGKPDTCKHCGRSNLSGHLIHWANKSGEYKRDLEDWIRLCVKCHKQYDANIS